MSEQNVQRIVHALRGDENPYIEYEANGVACRYCYARLGKPHDAGCVWNIARYIANPAPSGAGTIRERLMALAAKWEREAEVRDDGTNGRSALSTGAHHLRWCAGELREAASVLPVDEPTEPS